MRTLRLISPMPMVGADVAGAQELLADNRFGDFKPGEPDGIFGEITAAACVRAKRALGYPLSKCQPIFGDELRRYLVGGKLPPAYLARRLARLSSVKKALTKRERLVQKALSQIGTKEAPAGSNNVLYSRWYLGVAKAPAWAYWCAMFVSWCCDGLFRFRYAYVPAVVADARAHRNGLTLAPGPGDGVLATYDWQRDGVADHIGVCASEELLKRLAPGMLATSKSRFGALGAGEFWAVEGNTSVGNDSNGGEVMLRKRTRGDVAAFVLTS